MEEPPKRLANLEKASIAMVIETHKRSEAEGAFKMGEPAYILMARLPNVCNGGFIISENESDGDVFTRNAYGFTNALKHATAEHLEQCMGLQTKAILIVQENQDGICKVLSKLAENKEGFRAIRLANWNDDAVLWMLRRD